MSAFTQYWSYQTWCRESAAEGQPLEHTAASTFRKRGVAPDDLLYVVSVVHGRLHLIARMTVDVICDQHEAERRMGTALWEGTDHVLSTHGTPMRFQRRVPTAITRSLRFGDGDARLKIVGGKLDQQTLRSVRRLSSQSARLLDSLLVDDRPATLYPDEAVDERLIEGGTKQVRVNAFERNRKARLACIEYHGLRCCVCGLDFEERYGPTARGLIHVHHIRPVAGRRTRYRIDPRQDLRPVCPNCHAMLHYRRAEKPLTIEALGKMLRPLTRVVASAAEGR